MAEQSFYWDIDRTLTHNALFYIITGTRGCGKSYGAKKRAIKNWITKGEQFGYIRRTKDDLKESSKEFFKDVCREFPEYDDDRGVSLVILNTEKGANLFNSLKLEKIEVSAESSLRYNPSFYAPVSPHPNRSRFFSEVFRDDVDIISLMNGLTRTPINKRIVWKMKSIIKSAIRFIRRFFNTPFR